MPEKTTVRAARVAILMKDHLFGIIALDTGLTCPDGETRHVVGSNDPRCTPSTYFRSFPTPTEASEHFNEALALSRDRGWTVAHIGPRR